MTLHSPGVARRYARALLELALDKGDPAGFGRDLRLAADLWEAQAELQKVLAHPAVPAERKSAIAGAIFKGAPDLLSRLLQLLIERQRTRLLPDIARAYATFWNARRNVVAAHAVTASLLAAEQADALAKALGRAVGKTVELENTVDATVLGGVLVEMEGRTFDGTVRGRLDRLRHRLVEGTPAF